MEIIPALASIRFWRFFVFLKYSLNLNIGFDFNVNFDFDFNLLLWRYLHICVPGYSSDNKLYILICTSIKLRVLTKSKRKDTQFQKKTQIKNWKKEICKTPAICSESYNYRHPTPSRASRNCRLEPGC